MKQWTGVWLVLALVAAGPAHAADEKPRKWQTEVVKRGGLQVIVSATGTLEPQAVVDVSTQVRGQVMKLGTDPNNPKKTIDYGTRVQSGTVLAQLDPAPYEAIVDEARARLKRARATLALHKAKLAEASQEYERALKLLTKGALSKSEFDARKAAYEVAAATVKESEAAVQVAEADLKKADLNLRYTTIRSPINGVIVERRVNLGQTVGPGRDAPSLFRIATDLGKMRVLAPVAEADIGQIKRDQVARFVVDAYPKLVFEGRVSQIRLNAARKNDRVTYTVVIDVDNSKGWLLPYLTAHVQIAGRKPKEVPLVPTTALLWRPPLELVAKDAREKYQEWIRKLPRVRVGPPLDEVVWVPAGDHVRPVYVTLGETDGTMTEVLKGDLEGKAVVVNGARTAAKVKGKD
jgi:HlyD family secretion protein